MTSIPAACSSMGFPSTAPGPTRLVCATHNTKRSKGLAARGQLRQRQHPRPAQPEADEAFRHLQAPSKLPQRLACSPFHSRQDAPRSQEEMPACQAAKFSIKRLLFLQPTLRSRSGPTAGTGSRRPPSSTAMGSHLVPSEPQSSPQDTPVPHSQTTLVTMSFFHNLIKSFSYRKRKETKCSS